MAYNNTPEFKFESGMFNISKRPVDIYTDEERIIYEIINNVILSVVVSLFGVVTNIINIIVFYKQGFNNTVTISFFGLAISDLCSLLTQVWFGIVMNPLVASSDIGLWPAEIVYLTAGMPHILFVRITGWITVFVTADRCLCIALPLKIKQIVTPRRATLIIITIYIVVVMTFAPEYATSYHCYKFIEKRNRTLIGLCFSSHHDKVAGLVFVFYSTLGLASFIAVIIFTVALVVQLNQKSQWRVKANISQDQSASISNRDRKTMTMVVMISSVLIVCYTPGVIVSMAAFFEEDFGVFGAYVNAFYVMWSIVFVFENINSSINIFFYYNMSMKYRDSFRQLFACWSKGVGD